MSGIEKGDILNVVHGSNGSVSISHLSVTDESEATAAAGIAVLDNDLERWSGGVLREKCGWEATYSLLNGAELLELGAESTLVGVPCKAAMSIVSGEVNG